MVEVTLHGEERSRIAAVLGREPTRVELHAFDAQWSEHCSYKSSRTQLRRLPTQGARVVLGPGEDAGILHLGEHDGEGYAIVIAHESHNHPSQVVPFEGAATGVGGIVRDVLCMGARVIGIADALRFGDVRNPASHQRYVARAVVDGISAYGNAIGVPNLAGDVYFHEGFNENCLVNVIALGLVKEREIVHSFAPPQSAGWPILLVGKATDASGFGGASFSSLTLDSENEAMNRGAVQVPDPFLKNVLMRATYRVFDLLHSRGITAGCKDLGAGGVMGCSAEIVAAGGFGARIELDRINAVQTDLPPEVLAIGETQERMLFVLPPEIADEVMRVYNEEFSLPQIAHNARAVVIGEVTRERRYVLAHRGASVMDVDIEFLTKPIEEDRADGGSRSLDYAPSGICARDDRATTQGMLEVLSHLDACSREPLYQRYDAVVRGFTVIPRGYADAGVIAPILGSQLGVALAVAGNPRYGEIDPRLAAEYAVFEAVRKVAAVGARPIGLTDCLNFGNPQKPEHYAEFVRAVDGLEHAARELGLPFVSGNVSFYNESSSGQAIPSAAIVACIGVIDDVARVVTPGLKEMGSALLFTDDIDTVVRAIEAGEVRACAVVDGGGLSAAVAKMAFAAAREGRSLGVELSSDDGCRGGFVVEVSAERPFDVAPLRQAQGRCAQDDKGKCREMPMVGRVIGKPELVFEDGKHVAVADLHEAWVKPLAEVYL